MKPVYQTIHGLGGNCFEACVASILELDLAEVPGFGTTCELQNWLRSRDMIARFPLRKTPEGYSIASLRTQDGSVHAVVCLDGRIVHDPSPRPFAKASDLVMVFTVLEELS